MARREWFDTVQGEVAAIIAERERLVREQNACRRQVLADLIPKAGNPDTPSPHWTPRGRCLLHGRFVNGAHCVAAVGPPPKGVP